MDTFNAVFVDVVVRIEIMLSILFEIQNSFSQLLRSRELFSALKVDLF